MLTLPWTAGTVSDVLTAVDLFCGGGGLTVGLKNAGFDVVAGIEIDPDAHATYKTNHPEVRVFRQDIRTLPGRDLVELSPTGQLDLLAGCPPCQGFSSLTRKYRDRTDPRNSLVREMGRLVKESLPRAVMMENVPGLATMGEIYFLEFLDLLRNLGYLPTWKVLQVADYGVPQYRRRLVLLAGRGFRIELPQPTHHRVGSGNLEPWKTLRDAISGLSEPVALSVARGQGGPGAMNWNVVRDVRPITIARLKATRPGGTRSSLPEELRPQCHRGTDEGFTNVYGRMTWDQVPVTITAGCLTLSKGRFGHPEQDRTISLREAARIQTFPDSYVFATSSLEKATQIVGNALPCDFAEVVSEQCARSLSS